MFDKKRVVVTGIGAITPLGNDLETTWKNMINGKNAISNITYFDTENFKAKLAAEVKDFNPKEYLDVNEILRTDRYTQYALAATKQAVDDSGIQDKIEKTRFSVVYGTGIGGISTFETEHKKLLEKGPRRVSPLFIPMMIGNMAAGFIAIKHGCMGSVMPAVTACASGSTAIGEAMRLIKNGYADAVVAGGSEAAITPSALAGFINIQALSTSDNPNEASLPFDNRRGGFVMGEGAVTIILEEYEHAVKRGAKIYAEVCGYGATCDASHITAPHPEAIGATNAMKIAMEESSYKNEDVVYINAHGTGTPMNDALETLAIKKAMGNNSREALVSSTKSMTGHMLGAAGAIEALACIMALSHKKLPPTINLKEQDSKCDLYYIPEKAIEKDITLALSNSLGFGGHNVCLGFRKV